MAAGDWDTAVDKLSEAAAAVKEVEREALISPGKAGEFLLSWALNDTYRGYYGEGYERAMLHSCLGLAYLARGQVEDLLVEVRLANRLLETEEKLYETEYQAGGMAHALSAIAYELRGDLDDAYIDYKRMAEKDIGGEFVGRSLVRLSRLLGRDAEFQRWSLRYGDEPLPAEDSAHIVLVAGIGLGPYKEEQRLDIPTSDGMLSWAVPVFRERPQAVPWLTLDLGGGSVRTVTVEDVGRVAKKNLADRIAWLAAKSTVRTFLKREFRKEIEDRHGQAVALLGDLFTIVSERADLRAWTTLPDSWQVASAFVPPGANEVTVSSPGAQPAILGAFHLEPGETLFVIARTLGKRVHAHAIGGRRIGSGPGEVPARPIAAFDAQ